MLTILYNIIIMPLILLMDLIFGAGYRLFGNPGIAIIGVSLGVNVFSLPLYRRADAIQNEERELQKIMAPDVKHIKKTFKGDEQFMILQTYYNQMKYSPLMVFRGSLPLLLQIPFFTAAYRYLSGLSILKGASFLALSDMGSPDGLVVIGSITINILPILMTLINFISGMIYTKGFPIKDKAQLYVLALVFMIILYNSPSGLVFYWTLNNLFSLFKNIFLKLLPSPEKFVDWILGVGSIGVVTFLALSGHLGDLSGMTGFNNLVLAVIIVIILNIPLFRLLTKNRIKMPEVAVINPEVLCSRTLAFFSSFFMVLLTGIIIPIAVISDNPLDFMDNDDFVNPLKYIQYDMCVALGLFVFWGVLVYFSLMGEKERRAYNILMCSLSTVSIIDFMVFNRNFGNISTNLRFDDHVAFSRKDTIINLVVVLAAILVVYILVVKKVKLVEHLLMLFVISGLVFSGIKIYGVNTAINQSRFVKEANALMSDDSPIFHLSRKGKNVVILFLDRAINGYFPYIMNEKPELADKFDGFTYYPNTISYGTHTNFGSSPLYGGYEYTPYEMNKREDESLKDKHDESLLVLPVLFSEAGYEVTVADPADAGYSDPPDLSIFDGYERIHAYNTVTGQYFNLLSDEEKACWREDLMFRKYFFYSLFRVSPFLVQPHIYDEGNYLSVESTDITKRFLNRYSVIKNLSYLTEIDDNETGDMLFIDNTTPHEPVVLQMPDYIPVRNVDNSEYDDISRFTLNGRTVKANDDPVPYHYHVNMTSYLRVGEWFDYMRSEGVYDNTRIIIVADHGRDLAQFEDLMMDDGKLDVMHINPILLVKDFDSHGKWKTDNSFMTNADTPVIALKGIIDNPQNPFTGKTLDSSEKTAHDQYIPMSEISSTGDNNGNIFDTSDADWYSVHDDIFDEKNWKNMGSYEDVKAAVGD